MEEHAKEELKLLEAQYPNQHEHLKNELRSFIFQLQTNHQDSEQLPENNNFSTHLAFFDTEESTSLGEQRKRSDYDLELALADRLVIEKIGGSSELETPKSVVVKHFSSRKNNKRKDRVDLVLERAQVCLKKIKHLKTFLLSPPPEI
ncbi:hypothetical protein AAZX31_11G211100 [Glycine max]|uniref:Uncharacterized protein n=2 Tax=Glycine subgen. Soja TaxID=1462606 RepID=K7LR90_SOYBN|nr:uncharacterized protein LOC102659448 [Glycine max]XP_028189411.1 uncharacterized protein LOC114375757 [Glycine soja]XP_028189412.1 uncharacterized protein LOC114375757 [Glycine soja]KAG4974981.1 hypothetical protein JHK87_031802 [Glycine soja]KAG4989550.1 hypothetical protein JHK85_032533 [Glycine max]KAG4995138.1 hypothetical protein JHK86_031965 [Glycine max]KAG5125137.1 hypothetical protein JHK82_031874 [Glycine max]KAG5146564.1 hypothetical protein JHK84_032107 [Glycine max]|eukprot:XP_006591279.1 uncharacterized protein LOC102659448 [Glycine max]